MAALFGACRLDRWPGCGWFGERAIRAWWAKSLSLQLHGVTTVRITAATGVLRRDGCDATSPLRTTWLSGTSRTEPPCHRLDQAYSGSYVLLSPVPPVRRSRPQAAREDPVEEWAYLDQEVLVPSRSRKACLTCHFFRHHAGVNCIPLLTCQLHQGLIAQGEHLVSRCPGWTEDLVRQRGWAPEVG